jgi:hypothetical protein
MQQRNGISFKTFGLCKTIHLLIQLLFYFTTLNYFDCYEFVCSKATKELACGSSRY